MLFKTADRKIFNPPSKFFLLDCQKSSIEIVMTEHELSLEFAQELSTRVNYFVKKSNDVTQAIFFDLSLTAYRAILLAGTDKFLAQLEDPHNTDFKIRIHASDYYNVYYKPDSDMSPVYRLLKESVDELLDAKLMFRNYKQNDEKGRWSGGVNWISKAQYNDTLKILEVEFNPSILPYLQKVNTQYTYYNLRHIAELSSMHSVRLFELMMFWRKRGKTPAMSISMMRAWLGISVKEYLEDKIFTRDVIKKAVDEINEKDTHVQISLEVLKDGRKTTGYQFSLLKDVTPVK